MLSSTQPCVDIDVWRANWGALLHRADEILCFSEASKRDVLRAYPDLDASENLIVKPHTQFTRADRIPRADHLGPIVLGVVGAIGMQKGSRIIRRMAKLIESQKINARIVIVGESDINDYPSCVRVTGRYSQKDLPDIIERNSINFVALTSIWPETFSYVTSELMAMHLRILAFDLGAPAERLKEYPMARLVRQINAEAMLEALLAWHDEATDAVSH